MVDSANFCNTADSIFFRNAWVTFRNPYFIGVLVKHIAPAPRCLRDRLQITATPSLNVWIRYQRVQTCRILARVPVVFLDSNGNRFHIYIRRTHFMIFQPRWKSEYTNHDYYDNKDKQLKPSHPTVFVDVFP